MFVRRLTLSRLLASTTANLKPKLSGAILSILVATPSIALDSYTGTKTAPAASMQDEMKRWSNNFSIGELVTLPDEDFEYSKDWLARQEEASGDEQWECLSEALYFEARGESVKGQFAVAEVILNRVESPLYPDSICKVVNQGTGRKYQCQFTYTCDGKKEIYKEKKAQKSTQKIAAALIAGDAPRALTEGATHYHTKAVSPSWSRRFFKVVTIGVHHFYRQPGSGTNS
ncbi:cell wall hydrolase [Falsihalocynthiibacter sp. SS001]|uniref:cell wall hydrolase n=1 Tax=Falsihalocynthiibacter sp. SS001 TaxID=3349698 RepID=UPI0036D2E0E6